MSVMNFEGTSRSASGSTGKKIRRFNRFASSPRERASPLAPIASGSPEQYESGEKEQMHGNAPGSAPQRCGFLFSLSVI